MYTSASAIGSTSLVQLCPDQPAENPQERGVAGINDPPTRITSIEFGFKSTAGHNTIFETG